MNPRPEGPNTIGRIARVDPGARIDHGVSDVQPMRHVPKYLADECRCTESACACSIINSLSAGRK